MHSVKSLYGYRVSASDGLAGSILDFYFNDQDFSVRNLVVSQHPTRLHKASLLDPASIRRIDNRENLVSVTLSRDECDALPSAAKVVPVCRQYSMQNASPGRLNVAVDPHLRCTTAITGYEFNNGERHLGIVSDFIVDTAAWKIAFVVGRRFGLREADFLVPASAVNQISFAARRVSIRKDSHWNLVFAERNGYDRCLEAIAA